MKAFRVAAAGGWIMCRLARTVVLHLAREVAHSVAGASDRAGGAGS